MSNLASTRLEIDLNALEQNYNYFKARLDKETKTIAAVKANAYGTDAVSVAKHLETLGIDYLAVVFTREGVALRKAGVKKPILVFQAMPQEISEIVAYNLEPSLYSENMFQAFCEYAKNEKLEAYPVHLKFNTGMNRLGMPISKAKYLGELLKENTNIKLNGIYTHFAASDNPEEREFTLEQLSKFNTVTKELEAILGYMPMLHATNTMGIINYPEAHFNAVRLGIGLYGYTYEEEINKRLKPVARLYAPIIQKQYLNPGDSISYSRTYIAKEAMQIGIVPLGHADGINRAYGKGKGWVFLNGHKVPILGNVCMDMFMIDLTGIDSEEGDLVEVFGENNSGIDLANAIETIVYELITGITARVPRIITGNHIKLN